MIEVNRPLALIYNWESEGEYEFFTDLYSFDENVMGWINLLSIRANATIDRIRSDFAKYSPDVLLILKGGEEGLPRYISEHSIIYDNYPDRNTMANDVLRKSVYLACNPFIPKFSVFTPSYMTSDRIKRTYEGLAGQTLDDWEWIVVDDSPEGHDETWTIIREISGADYRVKPYRITPNSKGKVGTVKNLACSLSNGEWLVELDHDDYLLSTCLEECWNAHKMFPDAGFMYSDVTEMNEEGRFIMYDHTTNGDFYAREDNWFNFGYSGHTWVNMDGRALLRHHYPSINPLTIRFNLTMPNHVRVWRKDVYDKIGKHNKSLPIADDFELIVRTFLETRMIHIKKVLYIQYNNGRSTVNENSFDINRRSRVIREFYDHKIHNRILELGYEDWEWDYDSNKSIHPTIFAKKDRSDMRYGEDEQVLNYVYE